jgi:integrase
VVRDGKGGWSPGIYLNDDMLAAWRLFAAANAWGYYNVSSFAVAIRNAGWPAHIRPYQARHTTWITAVERGADMADVQVGAGHKSLATTRIYTGVRASRMQGLSETLEGRFAGWPDVEKKR